MGQQLALQGCSTPSQGYSELGGARGCQGRARRVLLVPGQGAIPARVGVWSWYQERAPFLRGAALFSSVSDWAPRRLAGSLMRVTEGFE
jgi:hypothetical protein